MIHNQNDLLCNRLLIATYSTADDVIQRYQRQVESADSPVLPEARCRFSEWIRDGKFASAVYGIPAAVADGLWDHLTPSSGLVDVPATILMIRSLTTYAPAITSSSLSGSDQTSFPHRVVDRISDRVRCVLMRIAIPVLVDANRAAMEAFRANAHRALPLRLLAYMNRFLSYLSMAVERTVARAIQWFSERFELQAINATVIDEGSIERILNSVCDDDMVGTVVRATTEQLHDELIRS